MDVPGENDEHGLLGDVHPRAVPPAKSEGEREVDELGVVCVEEAFGPERVGVGEHLGVAHHGAARRAHQWGSIRR